MNKLYVIMKNNRFELNNSVEYMYIYIYNYDCISIRGSLLCIFAIYIILFWITILTQTLIFVWLINP